MHSEKNTKRIKPAEVFYVRLKQFATTFFVILTSTLMIQNVWYPASFSSFKKSWRAGVGALIFLMGFAVARALFESYGEQVRNIKQREREERGRAGKAEAQAPRPGKNLQSESGLKSMNRRRRFFPGFRRNAARMHFRISAPKAETENRPAGRPRTD
jgi:hypothetical protein